MSRGRVLRALDDSADVYLLSVPRSDLSASEPLALTNSLVHESYPEFDLETLVRESSRLVDTATGDAYRIIKAAHRRAQTLLEKAHVDAEEIEKRAREDGMSVGRAEAFSHIEQDLREARETMTGILESTLAQRRSLIESAESEIIRLAYVLAKRIVQSEIESNPDLVVENARSAIKRLVERERVTIRVNPEDLERMRSHREDMLAFGDIREVRVIADARVDRGGVILETDGGTIDARISVQLEEAQRVLGIDESDGG